MKKLLNIIFIFCFTFTGFAQEATDVIENSLSSVVTVAVYRSEESYRLFGMKNKTRGENTDLAYQKVLNLGGAEGSGSGFVINVNGKKYVITNAHVIESASDLPGSIKVFSISRAKYDVKIVGGDSFYDIAVLEFVTPPGKEVTTINFRTKDVKIGEQVYAIGNPLGQFPYSVSDGIISGKNRVRGEGATGKFGFLQSTATLIWGNSGGPLIDKYGEVVGINSQIMIYPEGEQAYIQPQINFALESPICRRLINDIINNNGFVRRSFMGIELSQNIEFNTYFKSYETKDTIPVISGVIPGSPSESVLRNKIGYSITKVGDMEVTSNDEVLGEFEKIKPGDEVTLTIMKNGQNDVVRFKTTELNPQRLEDIAKFVISNKGVANLSKDNEGIYIKIPNSFSQYRILSAGVNSEQVKQMWMISSLSDLGAVLKLSGMYGIMDLYIIKKDDFSDSVLSDRLYFSGSENRFKLTLWY